MARLRTCSRLRMLISHSTDREALKSVAWGLVWVMGAVWFWLHLAGSPIDDFRLMLYATTAQGQIVETWEDVGDRDDGGVDWFYSIAYTFKLPNGREVRSFSKGSGRLSAELADLKESRARRSRVCADASVRESAEGRRKSESRGMAPTNQFGRAAPRIVSRSRR
jgi:hypothetical protein